MKILQTLKDFFSRYFPLHLNSTVQDLEDDLEQADWQLDVAAEWINHLRGRIKDLTATNNEYRKENAYLTSNLGQARQHIRVVQNELDELYKSMTPKLSSWPMPVSAHLEDTPFARSVIRVELPPLRLSCMVNEAVRRGLYQGYIEEFANSIASTARKEVKAAVEDILNNVLPLKTK